MWSLETTLVEVAFRRVNQIANRGRVSLLGRAHNELSNMDSGFDPAATANNYILVYGDFSIFLVVESFPASIELIENLFGANQRPTGQRGAFLWARTGSDVLVPQAFRLLNVATTA